MGNNNQTGQSRIKSSSQLDPPRNGKDDKVLDSIEEQPKIFGITFKAQKTNKVETNNPMRGKRKVSATPKMTHENAALRKARVQKKSFETISQPYERRTRSKKGNQDDGNKDTTQNRHS